MFSYDCYCKHFKLKPSSKKKYIIYKQPARYAQNQRTEKERNTKHSSSHSYINTNNCIMYSLCVSIYIFIVCVVCTFARHRQMCVQTTRRLCDSGGDEHHTSADVLLRLYACVYLLPTNLTMEGGDETV